MESGYWQVDIILGLGGKSTRAGSGVWWYEVMPFGPCNAPVSFEQLMIIAFKTYCHQFTLVP